MSRIALILALTMIPSCGLPAESAAGQFSIATDPSAEVLRVDLGAKVMAIYGGGLARLEKGIGSASKATASVQLRAGYLEGLMQRVASTGLADLDSDSIVSLALNAAEEAAVALDEVEENDWIELSFCFENYRSQGDLCKTITVANASKTITLLDEDHEAIKHLGFLRSVALLQIRLAERADAFSAD